MSIGDNRDAGASMAMAWLSRKPHALFLVGLLSLLFFLRAYRSSIGGPGNIGHFLSSAAGPDAPTGAGTSQTLGITLHPNDHVYRDAQVVNLSWRVSAGFRYPDGVKKRVYLVNNEFPGPTVEARSGDELVIHVQNELADEGVSIHWHGLPVPNAMDGAVGFTQCPIPPGKGFTYRFTVPGVSAGTFWWHAHFQSQRGDGLFGGLVVHRPHTDGEETDAQRHGYAQEVLVMVGDWFHRSAEEIVEWYTSPQAFGNEPVPDSLLVNGRGRFDCAMAVRGRPVECSELLEADVRPLLASSLVPTRLRFVNVGTVAGFSAMVSGASLQLIAVDGGFPVEAAPADGLGVVYPGERADAVARWRDEGSVQSRLLISLDDENLKYTNPSLNRNQSFPILDTAAHSASSTSSGSAPESAVVVDITRATASVNYTGTMPDEAQHTVSIYLKTQKLARYGNKPMGYTNHTSWAPQAAPLLSLPRTDWDKNQLVPYIPMSERDGSPPVWVDLVLNNLDEGSHPFHLHGSAFYVMSRYRAGRGGWGSWNPLEGGPPPGGPADRPLLKDTVSVPRRGHAWLRFPASSEGIWMLHCHMAVHSATGMAMAFHIGPEGDEAHVLGMKPEVGEGCATVSEKMVL